MKNTFLLLGGIVGAGYLLSKGYNTSNAIKNLEYKNPKIKVGKLSLAGVPLDIKLDIINNSSENISLEYFTGNVNYQGKQLSSFTFNGNGKQIIINRRGSTQVPFTVIIKNIATISTLIKIVKQIAAGQSVDTVLNIDGRFYAAGIDLPVNFFYDIKTQTLVENSTKKIKSIAGIGSTGAVGSFNMDKYEQSEFNRAIKEYHEWLRQKLQPGYREDEARFIQTITRYKRDIKENVEHILNGNYGEGQQLIIKNWYQNLAGTDKRRKQGLRAIAINVFLLYCSNVFNDLNRAKVVSLIKSKISAEENEAMLNDFEKEIESSMWGWLNELGIKN